MDDIEEVRGAISNLEAASVEHKRLLAEARRGLEEAQRRQAELKPVKVRRDVDVAR